MIQTQHEKWWSKTLSSDLKHLSDSTQKEKLLYLFTALATLLSFKLVLLPGVSNCQEFPPVLSTPQGSPGSSFSLLFSALKTWEVTSSHIVSWKLSNAIQRSGSVRQEMQFEGKKENPGNILWQCHPSYITKELWDMLGWYLIHPAASVQDILSPWQWWSSIKEKKTKTKNPGDFRGGWRTVQEPGPMKGCRSPSWWPWRPVGRMH